MKLNPNLSAFPIAPFHPGLSIRQLIALTIYSSYVSNPEQGSGSEAWVRRAYEEADIFIAAANRLENG